MFLRLRSVALVLSAAIFLAGCSALNLKRSVADEDLAKSKRVAVVSILGNTFYGVSVGTTVFNNSYFESSVPDWKIDAYTTKLAVDMLRAGKKFEVAELDRTGLNIDQMKADEGKLVWEAAKRQGFDTLVIMWPSVSSNFPFFKPGYGLAERSMFGMGRKCIYAGYTVNVYDVSTQKPTGWEWGGGAPCELGSDNDISFKDSFDSYSAQEKLQMRQRLEARLRTSMEYSMQKLSLVPGK